MKLRVRAADLTTYEPIVLLNAEDCLVMGVGPTDRVRIEGRNPAVATVTITDFPDIRGCISMPTNLLERCRVSKGDYVDVSYSPLPGSIRSVRKKINGGKLAANEIVRQKYLSTSFVLRKKDFQMIDEEHQRRAREEQEKAQENG